MGIVDFPPLQKILPLTPQNEKLLKEISNKESFFARGKHFISQIDCRAHKIKRRKRPNGENRDLERQN